MNTESKNIHMNVEKEQDKQQSSTELIKRKELKGTPFTIITMEGKSFGTLGRHRITETGKYKDIKEDLEKFSWDRIMQMIVISLQEQDKINEEINKLTNKENEN